MGVSQLAAFHDLIDTCIHWIPGPLPCREGPGNEAKLATTARPSYQIYIID